MPLDDRQFGIALSCTPSFVLYALASICTIRNFNATIPIALSVDTEIHGLADLARELDFAVCRRDEVTAGIGDEHVRSRLLKVEALAEAQFEWILLLDSDTLALEDPGVIGACLPPAATCCLLLRRPFVPTLWDWGRAHFTDPAHDDASLTRLLNATFDLGLTAPDLDRLTCWNGGVIAASRASARRVGSRWRDLYRRMIAGPTKAAFVPNDQLALWLTLREAIDGVAVAELPRRFNFMPGLTLDLAPGTAHVDESCFDGVSILHLGGSKLDPWALDRVAAAFERAGIVPPWPLPAAETALRWSAGTAREPASGAGRE